jgi:hypothetical protein
MSRRWAFLAILGLAGCPTGLSGVWCVDRIDEGRAVLVDESGASRVVDAADLPPGTRDGAVLVDGVRDVAREQAAAARVRAHRQALRRDDGRDLVLGQE